MSGGLFVCFYIQTQTVACCRWALMIWVACSVHYPNNPCGDGEETPLTRHCFFMTVSFPLSVL